MGSAQSGPALADKLSELVATVHEPGRGPYSTREIADAINEKRGRPVISHSTVANLLSGKQTNPTKAVLELLAEFFHVPVAFFFDDVTAAEVSADLQLIAALRDAGVREVALRVAGLDDDARRAITTMIDALHRVRRQPSPHVSQRIGSSGGDDER